MWFWNRNWKCEKNSFDFVLNFIRIKKSSKRRRAFLPINEKNRFFGCDFVIHVTFSVFGVVRSGLVQFICFFLLRKREMTMASTVGHLMIGSFDWTISIEFVCAARPENTQNWVTSKLVLIDLSITIMIIFYCVYSFQRKHFNIIFFFFVEKLKSSTSLFSSFFSFWPDKKREFPLFERPGVRLYFDIAVLFACVIILIFIHHAHPWAGDDRFFRHALYLFYWIKFPCTSKRNAQQQ